MERAISFPHGGEFSSPDAQLNMWVRGVIAMRKRRKRTFGADLFHDQAWDLILQLAIAPDVGLTLAELSSQTDYSAESSRRWLKILAKRDLVVAPEYLRYRLTSKARDQLRSILP